MSFIKGLSKDAKAMILDEFIDKIEKGDKNGYGYIMGTHQIIDSLEQSAISFGFKKCPYCNR